MSAVLVGVYGDVAEQVSVCEGKNFYVHAILRRPKSDSLPFVGSCSNSDWLQSGFARRAQ
jgi:hypothetical protein